MNKILLTLLFFFGCSIAYTQVSNSDPQKGAVNISLPKTPESQGFERYGNIAVSEVTGTPDISIPIFTLKSSFLEVPVTLSYDPSGIKVSQEASWVGLGFNLIAGGRITVETRGAVDEDPVAQGLFAPSYVKGGMQKLFNRLGDSSSLSILTYASTCYECEGINDIPDHSMSMWTLAQYGLGEPDIFHVNFMGHSMKFYFDKINNVLKFIGEKKMFQIQHNRDSYNRILDWVITDNMGNRYYFDQRETTTFTLPPYGALYNNTATSAWLLTKIKHPAGDSIVFSYTNYGNSYPATNRTASVSVMIDAGVTLSNDYEQNAVVQNPLYLTKIESNEVAVDFITGNRTDLKGAGSKLLNQIKIRDKLTNIIKREIKFNYSYFSGTLESCYNSLPDSVKNFYRQRLRLDSLDLNAHSLLQAPYRFYYFTGAGAPHKYSVGQDHWGYYNGANNNYSGPCSPKSLIPNTGLASTYSQYAGLLGFNANRDCSPVNMPAMTMDSIVYPTGGSTKFIYEPHETSTSLGGGLRIKTIRNYGTGGLAGSTDYSYASGIYFGKIAYHTRSFTIPKCTTPPNTPLTNAQTKENVTAYGAVNDNDLLVAYGSVTLKQKDQSGNSNGHIVKLFHIADPGTTSSMGLGFTVLPAHWPTNSPHFNGTTYLYPQTSGFPPTPAMQLDGKIFLEKFFDNTNTLVKSIQYYYKQTDYSQDFYSLRVIDNQIGGNLNCGNGFGQEFLFSGQRRFTAFISPAKSFYTLTDSVVETTYTESNINIQKKEYKYNAFYQPEYEISHSSNGTQTILYTRWSTAYPMPYHTIYYFPSGAIGDALAVSNMWSANVYDLPIEQITLIRDITGDTAVVSGRYNLYDKNLVKKTYSLESSKTLPFNTDFKPSHISSYSADYDITLDPRYILQETREYNINNQLQAINSKAGRTSFVWDKYHNHLLAYSPDADPTDIAYTSFEAEGKGNWTYSDTPATDMTAPTGKKSYTLGNSITKSGLNASATYIVSYWKKSGTVSVNGTTPVTGNTINGWTYHEHKVVNPAGGTITVSGTSGVIDELRLYPFTTHMTTYSYDPLIGMTSQCDINNRVTYYEYDSFGRLSLVRDQDKNIIKKICYNYAGQEESCLTYGNQEQTRYMLKDDCPDCQIPSGVTYTVPANSYFASSTTAANTLAQNEIDANGQAYANANGTCTASVMTNINGYNGISGKRFTLLLHNNCTGTNYYIYLDPGVSGVNLNPQIPTGNYNVTITPDGGSGPYSYSFASFYQYANTASFLGIDITTTKRYLAIQP